MDGDCGHRVTVGKPVPGRNGFFPAARPSCITRAMSSRPYDVKALVVIPTCNAAAFLDRTLASVAASVAHHCERTGLAPEEIVTVVVDDASTDETVALAGRWRNRLHVTCLENPERRGTSYSRNRGATARSAEFVFFLDHDDEFLPGHIDICLAALAQHPQAGYVRTGVELTVPVHPDWLKIIASHLPINLCVRQDVHGLVGGFNEDESLRVLRCEDVLYANILDGFFQGVTVDEVTARHHHMPGNALDGQLDKFRAPPGTVQGEMSPDQRAASPQVHASHRMQLERAGRRLGTLLRTMKPVGK
jgi:glycosyltransferase involved in cell wall biosynthesis